jgi:hypothetical protein
MASTKIDTRGTVDSSSGTGLTVDVASTFNSSVSMVYTPSTTVQAIDASGSITYPGVYTLSNVTPAGVFLPAPSTVPGGMIVFRTLGSAAQRHFLTGTSDADLGVFITNGTTGGSKLTLGGTIGSSVALISDGRNFLQMSYSGSAPTYSNS